MGEIKIFQMVTIDIGKYNAGTKLGVFVREQRLSGKVVVRTFAVANAFELVTCCELRFLIGG